MTVLLKKRQLANEEAAANGHDVTVSLLDPELPTISPIISRANTANSLYGSNSPWASQPYGVPPSVLAYEPLPQMRAHHVSRLSDTGDADIPRSARASSGMGLQRKWYVADTFALEQLLWSSWFNLLLVCVPAGFAAQYMGAGPVWVFSLNFLSLIPLALVLGDITEDLALRFGDVAGGLINATFGNVTEVCLSLSALNHGLYEVVAMSLMGSILSNLLLVLGCCMFFGGLKYKLQSFNQVGNRACSSLLFLSTLGVVIPTAAEHLIQDGDRGPEWILEISRGTAIILFFCYATYLYFQLGTHKDLFQAIEEEDGVEASEPMMSLVTSLTLLTAITVVVAFASQFITGSLEEVSQQTGLGQAFLGMIVLPIAGNACEHITAVIVARKNKMDLALGVAVGSSIQIATFAIPLAVLYGWATGNNFSLSLDPFSALALMLSVVHANFVGSDATSHWLMGVQLIAVYFLLALTYYYR